MGEILAIKTVAPQPPVKVSVEDGILRLTLSNPPANALSLSVMAAIQGQLDGVLHDPSVRVIILAAAPGKVFCAGHDLKEMTARRADADGGEAFFEETFGACSRLMQSIVRHPKPVIAEIDGIATAAGCQLVASCDLAIASDQSTFGVNGIDVGLFCSTPGVALARGLRPKHAMEMLLTGEMVDASTAKEFGLINRVVPREYLNQVTMKYAQVIAAKSPSAVRLGKKTFYEQAGMKLSEAYDHASQVMVKNMLNADAQEGVAAFFGKRKPEWREE